MMAHPLASRLWQRPFQEQKFAAAHRDNDLTHVHRVLDVGWGPGTNTPHFAGVDYLGVDFNESIIDYARQRYGPDFLVADITQWSAARARGCLRPARCGASRPRAPRADHPIEMPVLDPPCRRFGSERRVANAVESVLEQTRVTPPAAFHDRPRRVRGPRMMVLSIIGGADLGDLRPSPAGGAFSRTLYASPVLFSSRSQPARPHCASCVKQAQRA